MTIDTDQGDNLEMRLTFPCSPSTLEINTGNSYISSLGGAHDIYSIYEARRWPFLQELHDLHLHYYNNFAKTMEENVANEIGVGIIFLNWKWDPKRRFKVQHFVCSIRGFTTLMTFFPPGGPDRYDGGEWWYLKHRYTFYCSGHQPASWHPQCQVVNSRPSLPHLPPFLQYEISCLRPVCRRLWIFVAVIRLL